MPRSAIIWTRSRELSLKVRYHRTQRMMISWSKCRPLKSSCAEVGSVIAGRYRHKASFSSLHQNPLGLDVARIVTQDTCLPWNGRFPFLEQRDRRQKSKSPAADRLQTVKPNYYRRFANNT